MFLVVTVSKSFGDNKLTKIFVRWLSSLLGKRVTVKSKRRRHSSPVELQSHFQILEEKFDKQHAEEDIQETLQKDMGEA